MVALEASPVEIPAYKALGEYANGITAQRYPLLNTLTKALQVSFRSVQRLLEKRLATLGFTEILKRRGDERERFLGYRLRFVVHLAGVREKGRER
jgi:hypothetical protein